MAENFDFTGTSPSLLCTETAKACFTNVGHKENDDDDLDNDSVFIDHQRSQLLFLDDDESVKAMVERETQHLPKDDYLSRLRNGDLEMRVRREALDWILKAHAHFSFGPLCVCLAVSYLDRFLSVYDLPKGKSWVTQLLAVVCFSLAAKMEEIHVPLSVDLQVREPKFVFEAKTIQRMELLVLSILDWRMQSITPCSYIDYFLRRINDNNQPSPSLVSRSIQLILGTTRGIDFLEFKPSEIGAAVAISVSKEGQAVDIDKAMPYLHHVEQGRVLKCVQLIKDLLSASVSSNGTVVSATSSVPRSPIGVLDVACFSYKTVNRTVPACPNSSHNSPEPKRRKLDIPPPEPNFES